MMAQGEWARVDRLVDGLGESSRYITALSLTLPSAGKGQKPDVEGWARTDRLLATIIDELAVANWQRGGGKSKKPDLMTTQKRRRRRERNDLSHFDQAAVKARLSSMGPQPVEVNEG